MTTKSSSFKVGRDAKTGLFIPVRTAQNRPNTAVVEKVPVRGPSKPNKK